jgi:hypothetical protein
MPLAAVAALLLGGCAGETYYKKPESAQLARVRFVGSGTNHDGILVTQFESPNCELGSSGGIMGVIGGIGSRAPIPLPGAPEHVRETGNTQQMIGFSAALGPAPLERSVAAGRDFIFTLRRTMNTWVSIGLPTTWTCTITRQFTPRPGEQYEVAYVESALDEKTSKPGCAVRVERLQAATDGTVRRLPEPSFRPAPQLCAPAAVK